MPVVLPVGASKDDLTSALRAAGIQTSMHYPAVHRFTYYKRRFPGISLPVTEDYADREVTLPLHPKLEERDVDFVTEVLAGALTTQKMGSVS